MKTKLILGVLAGAFAIASPTQAHHAVQASVDIYNVIEVSAVLRQIDWVNPHTWMHFELTLADGTKQRLPIESLGIAGLRRAGLPSKSAFQVGETYAIAYYPNRNGTPGGFMKRMVLPDGRSYDSTNSDPNAVPTPAPAS